MAIWDYAYSSRDINLNVVELWNCIFCKTELTWEVTSDESYLKEPGEIQYKACPTCGWWNIQKYLFGGYYGYKTGTVLVEGAAGSLKELSLADVSMPINEIRQYLVAKYESRFSLSPKIFEETVASVFKHLGYRTIVTGHTNDGGIDVILIDSNNEKIGVQVKRWKNAVKVEQIRALAGALLLGDFTKGVFVTTSNFQSGAVKTVSKFTSRGYPIELIDALRFYEALKIVQKDIFRIPDDFEPYLKNLRKLGNRDFNPD